MKDRDGAVRQAAKRKADGATDGEIIAWLCLETDAGVIDAIYVTRLVLAANLGDAKEMVVTHAAWRKRCEASSDIQDDAVRALEDEASSSD